MTGRSGRVARAAGSSSQRAASPAPVAERGGNRPRLRLVHDVRGPKVRLGALWFVLSVAAAWFGPVAIAALFGALAAVAALQTAYAWRRSHPQPHRIVAALGGLSLPVAALAGLVAVPVAALGAALAAAAVGDARRRRAGRTGPVPAALATLRCGLLPGLAAAAIVEVERFGVESVLTMLCLVAVYDAGDFLVGSGAANAVEGPLAGSIGVLVVTFTASILEPAPLSAAQVWVLGGASALLAPLGQVVGSALLPSGGSFAPALRRMDSLLLVAPGWLVFTLVEGIST